MYPAADPHKTYKRMIEVKICPLFIELVILKMVNNNAKKKAKPTWAPVPTKTESNMGEKEGGRKTSPWTNFHPVSSWASSIV